MILSASLTRLPGSVRSSREYVMTEAPSHDVTQLLIDWSNGNREALDQLIPLVYAELRRLAHGYLSRQATGHSLQTTALINEAFVRLIDQQQVRWQNRAHFFGIAAQTMRNILVDNARRKRAQKRGGGVSTVVFNEAIGVVNDQKGLDLVALDEALNRLADTDSKLSRLVELKFFGGLTIPETAEVLDVSPATVKRGWLTAKIWLRREIEESQAP